MSTPAVSIIYKDWRHFGAWSGYPRYAKWLEGMVRVRRVPPALHPEWMIRLMEKRLGWEPDHERLGCDLSAARRLLIGNSEVVHMLYGESDLFYAGRLSGLGHLRGNRLVCTFHHPPSVLEARPPGSVDFDRIDAVVALGSHLASYLRGKLGADRVFRASHGVDIQAWRPERSCRSSTPTCIFVGVWLRDFSMLEEVIRLVVHENPTTHFEIIAHGLELRATAKEYEALVAAPNVRVRSEGLSDAELRSVYQRAWVHVLPLTDSVANNALLEGMACGLPTVTTAVGDVLDYTTNRGAICVAPGDTIGMAEAILGLLKHFRHRESLGQAAREIAERMSLEAVARQHADIYYEVAHRRQLGFRTRTLS